MAIGLRVDISSSVAVLLLVAVMLVMVVQTL